MQKLEPFCLQERRYERRTRDIPAWPIKATNYTSLDRIIASAKYDGNFVGRRLWRASAARLAARSNNRGHLMFALTRAAQPGRVWCLLLASRPNRYSIYLIF